MVLTLTPALEPADALPEEPLALLPEEPPEEPPEAAPAALLATVMAG
jgi:hypothetical protein